ncbi:MAG: hypothetical protein A2937_00435 [Candidatus Yonathbacteria bacterium RIFCSPLOWO2_01_FULL_47_33b]|uniref:Type II secretion system protein GspG C-terminal domain-containing protein n=1 Tax=Candidatus Yonathbacteria bacterium RIFCSPLOWO2_01_FULL_47_33b TaxID=1802727 RepID=A0A1G2SH20_9BACT|nr:MAG: hypothetical protein A2937_00435 [Candidatus Yonathbacteria bacterium RIFCSPLOWO2_01_FULL_47_33b]
MIMYAKLLKTNGFTLIELLVVISIISLLSSVVLSSLNDARKKVSSTKTLSNALEYRKAIELYRTDNANYPNPGDTIYHCLGDYATNVCGNETVGIPGSGIYSEDTDLQSALRDYIVFPKNDPVPYAIGGGTWYLNGPIYKCNNEACTTAQMVSWTETQNSCIGGASSAIRPPSYNPVLLYYRECTYVFQ